MNGSVSFLVFWATDEEEKEAKGRGNGLTCPAHDRIKWRREMWAEK